MKLLIIFIYLIAATTVATKIPLVEGYALASFGWFLYIVGRLFVEQSKYDLNNDGLSWEEVKAYLKMNWIAFLFNGMLLVIAVPYAEVWWPMLTGLFTFSENWPFSELVYILAGGPSLIIQIVIDLIRSKIKK